MTLSTYASTRVFFLNDTAPTEIYPLSLHDALPISPPVTATSEPRRGRSSAVRAASRSRGARKRRGTRGRASAAPPAAGRERTRLDYSDLVISYSGVRLEKKKILQSTRPWETHVNSY